MLTVIGGKPPSSERRRRITEVVGDGDDLRGGFNARLEIWLPKALHPQHLILVWTMNSQLLHIPREDRPME
jgi:hypothetical protein